MSNLCLKIDCRENKIKQYFQENISSETLNYEICALDLGDFVFMKDNQPLLLIERKTISDLESSIKDGRHKEQKTRLLSNYSPSKIMYIIENEFSSRISSYQENILYGAITNTQFRDKIQVYRTLNIRETIKYLCHLYKKINKNPEFFSNNNELSSDSQQPENQIVPYESTIKLKKKDNLTPNICQMLQLAQIPGVSVNVSKIILNKYGSLKTLILEFGKNNDEHLLAEIEIETSTGKLRRIGKVTSSKIYQFLMN